MTPQRITYRSWFGLLLLAAIAVALRANAGLYRDLSEDEIIAVTHAMQPFWLLPIEVTRHDVHPFLYFMQLRLWSFLGTSDLWFTLNSTFWNVAAIVSIGLVGRRLYGSTVGVVAAVLLALVPPSVWMAQELRPYSWLYFWMIWAFYYTEIACRTGFGPWSVLLRLLAICVCIIYTHALGFLIVFLFGVYAFVMLLSNAADLRGYRNWLVMFGASAVSAIPPLATDLMRDANLGAGRGLADVIRWIPRMLLPAGDQPAALCLAAGVYLAVVILGLVARPTRVIAAVFLVLPLALAAVLDSAGFMMFKLNIFSTIAAPFVALVIARLAQQLRPVLRDFAVGLCACLFILGSIEFLIDRMPTVGFLAVAHMIRANEKPGDLVYAPQQSMFWGMAWYLVGPHWGSALAVSGVPNPSWRRMYNRLGPRLVRLLHLEPTTQTLTAPDGLVLLVGNDSVAQAAKARRVWLITLPRADLPVGFPPATLGTLQRGATVPIQLLDVTLYK